jgi:hypothetical protein
MEEKKYLTPEEIEESRQRVVDLGVKHRNLSRTLLKVNGLLLVFTIISMIVLQIKVQENADLAGVRNGLFVLCVGALIVLSIVWKVEEKRYKKVFEPFEQMFKNQFLPGLFASRFDTLLDFNRYKGIPKNTVIESDLFKAFTEIKSNDYLHAVYNGREFEYCDLELKEIYVGKDIEGNYQKTVTIVFKGIFIITDFDHLCDTPLKIIPGGGNSSFSTESVEFNRNFSIRCSNPTDALRILTPQMMENILELKKYCGKNITISFLNDKLYFCTEPGRDLLEIENNIEQPIFDKRNSAVKDLEYVTGILKLLNMPNLKSKITKFE